jgi:hypothetical protein
MSFREKSTWITFVLLLLFSVYFGSVAAHFIRPEQPHPNFGLLFVVLLIAIIVIEIAFHGIAAIRTPAEARTPQDERERLIALKAKRPAFFVLMVATFAALAVMHLHVSAWVMINATLCALWLGELTNYGAQLYFYRHGT